MGSSLVCNLLELWLGSAVSSGPVNSFNPPFGGASPNRCGGCVQRLPCFGDRESFLGSGLVTQMLLWPLAASAAVDADFVEGETLPLTGSAFPTWGHHVDVNDVVLWSQ